MTRAALLVVALTGCVSLDGLSKDENHVSKPASSLHPQTGCDASMPFLSSKQLDSGKDPSVFGARFDAAKSRVVFNAGFGMEVELRLGGDLASATPAPFAALVPAQKAALVFPSLTPDGLALYYAAFFPDASGSGDGTSVLHRASRRSIDSAFDPPEALPQSGTLDFTPYLVSTGHALYFMRPDPNEGTATIVRLPIDTSGDLEVVFTDGAGTIGNPVVTPDELTLYYGDGRAGSRDVFVATRVDKTQPFANGHRIDSVSTTAHEEEPTWISDDQCELVYELRRPGDSVNTVWSATRRSSSAR